MFDPIYNEKMSKGIDEIRISSGGTFRTDGSTENLSKYRSNVVLHTSLPLSIELLKADLN